MMLMFMSIIQMRVPNELNHLANFNLTASWLVDNVSVWASAAIVPQQ